MRYFKRRWDETRGDAFDGWGTSTWFFEVGADGHVEPQIEVYQFGQVLKYDRGHFEDGYGGLAESALNLKADGLLPFETTAGEFERAWLTLKALNRSSPA